jgi:DNA polymerase elongation subunit (family B)
LSDPTLDELWFYPQGDIKKRKKIKKQALLDLLKTKCIFSRNNTLFLKHSVKQGVVSGWCKHFYNLRKTTKKKMQALDLAIYKGEIPKEKIAETKVEIQNLDAKQMAYKLAINSIYGILGTNHSPLYIVELAQSITRHGKFCNISASKFIAKTFKEKYGVDDNYISAISGDTDSQFVNISCIAKHLLDEGVGNGKDISKWSDDDKLKLWKFVNNFVEDEVNPYVQNLISSYCHTEHPEVLRYSLEYVSAQGIYEAKKHYATRKVIAEGPELVDKIKFSGIELKKASVPARVKDVLKDIYEGILLHGWSEKNFIEYIYNIWDDFKMMSIDEISFWKGYSSAREATGFLQMQKGSTAVASASTYYNQIIKKLGLGKKYDQILLGQKVRFCYVKPTNEYRISYIAFPDGQWPREFDQVFEIDYEVMFDKLVSSSLKGFMTATKFSRVNPSKQVEFDIFDL